MADLDCDLAIAGGGLAGGLIALAFSAKRPDVRVLLVEKDDGLGGNHIWSFFDGDVPDRDRWLIDPMIAHHWHGGHQVRFPGYEREMRANYNSVTSAAFDAHLRTVLGNAIIPGEVERMSPAGMILADGRTIAAKAVIDARGGGDLSALRCGWQKFLGQHLRLASPHGLTRPVIMDATVEQIDGYRFIYLLPISRHEIFVEDTYYSDTPDLDIGALRGRISAYAQAQDWQVEAVLHEETGVLPVLFGGDFDRFWPESDPVARAGVRAGLFHPMTGYSLPDAVACALWLADQPLLNGHALANRTRERARAHWRRGGYYRLLGRMLFRAAEPDARYRIFSRFYRLSPGLIGRFYGGRSTAFDKMRILCGRPPVPIRAAMRALLEPTA